MHKVLNGGPKPSTLNPCESKPTGPAVRAVASLLMLRSCRRYTASASGSSLSDSFRFQSCVKKGFGVYGFRVLGSKKGLRVV